MHWHRCVARIAHRLKYLASTFNYYFEASVRNSDEPVWALHSGLKALQAERYFLSDPRQRHRGGQTLPHATSKVGEQLGPVAVRAEAD